MVDEREKANRIIERASKDLDKLDVKYFLGVCKQMPEDPSGGFAATDVNAQGTDIQYMLETAFPTKQDKIHLGIWVGDLIKRDIKPILKK